MEIDVNTRVGDIVKENFRTARIFDQNKIDFCCGGGISLLEACNKAHIDIKELQDEIKVLISTNDPDSKYIDSLELDELCDYIVRRHHTFVNENLPFLLQKLDKLCDVHGENHPELFEIKDLFGGAAGNLSAHMKKEELILFPYIRKMVKIKKGSIENDTELGDIQQPIKQMEDEHQTEGERFKKISQITSDYTCPPDGCNTFRITYQTLNDFEKDLHRHIHLENNILFVKAVALEEELTKKK